MLEFIVLSAAYSVLAIFLFFITVKLDYFAKHTKNRDVVVWVLMCLVPYLNIVLSVVFTLRILFLLGYKIYNSKWFTKDATWLVGDPRNGTN